MIDYLAEAQKLIKGEKREEYGPVKESFELVATLWSCYLYDNITPKDVAMMMILFKFAREMHKHKADNLIDMAGYIGCIPQLIYND